MKKLNNEISRLKISFDKYFLKQNLELFDELNNFDMIIKVISLNYKPSSYESSFGISLGGTVGVIIGYFSDDAVIAASSRFAVFKTLSFSSASYAFGIGLLALGV